MNEQEELDMVSQYRLCAVCLLLVLLASATALHAQVNDRTKARSHSAKKEGGVAWYFAVSGDSRDCGDLIMPKIARAIKNRRATTPVQFYWHLGDLRANYRIDCDIAKRANPAFNCLPEKRNPDEITAAEKRRYLNMAWTDFIQNQARSFARNGVRFFLGVGNHELGTFRLGGGVERTFTRDEFRMTFRRWLAQSPIERQRRADRKRGISSRSGDTYYHFIRGGAEFIY